MLCLGTSPVSWVNLSNNLFLAYQSFGVIFGVMSISPLYIYKNVFIGKLQTHQNEETIFGMFSLIFWSLTIIPLLKYAFIVLGADDSGEGGLFALYSLLCRHAKFSLLPNQQAADEELSTYKYGPLTHTVASSSLTRFLESHKQLRTVLLVVVLFGASMFIASAILTPGISILSSLSGLRVVDAKFTEDELVLFACIILVGLFALLHCGTHRVAFLFAPIVIIWLVSLFVIGLYNAIYWNPKIVHAFSPIYIVKFFDETGKGGWISLGGILLSITGAEAMFSHLGHFTALSIRLAFVFVMYPCLVMQYMGQAAFLSKNPSSIFSNIFYDSIPGTLFWPIFIIATFVSVVASQAILTSAFSILKQCHALGCFPRVKVVHTSKHLYGQIYIPEINWILMIITLAVTIGLHDTIRIGNAYGLACMMVMFITTLLVSLVIMLVWHRTWVLAALFLLFFGFIEGVYLSSAFTTVPKGGWIPIALSAIFTTIMYVWHYGSRRKYSSDLHSKVSLKWLLKLGPTLGIVRVPGMGIIYSELATGVPSIFSHFVANVPALHEVLVFVCVKSVPVPFVPAAERFLIGRICPRPFRMYRCIVRYGYKDIIQRGKDLEYTLVQSIAEFIAMEPRTMRWSEIMIDGRMAVVREGGGRSVVVAVRRDTGDHSCGINNPPRRLEKLRGLYNESGDWEKRKVRLEIGGGGGVGAAREEILGLIGAKEGEVAYIMGHSYVKARRSSSFLKKLVIDIVYSFLRKNCRSPAVALNIPHTSLIEVGLVYYV